MENEPHEPVASLSAAEAERVLLRKLEDEKESPHGALRDLAEFYGSTRQFDKAFAYFRQLKALARDVEEKAHCLLNIGQVMEGAGDFPAAVRYYREALALAPTGRFVSYFINNNLGYSLNVVGDFASGEIHCRKAIAIDPDRPNGHKNLGVALAGQGRYAEAAQCFVDATEACPRDTRAMGLLIKLHEKHPDLEIRRRDDAQRSTQTTKRAKARKVIH